MNILPIRERLNQLAFVRGERRILIGRISEESGNFELSIDDLAATSTPATTSRDQAREIAREAVDAYLQDLASQLQAHDLRLHRGDEEPLAVYAVQSLRGELPQDLRWMTEATNWTTRITTVGLEMVVPGLIGLWLDQRLQTKFLAVLGFVCGVVLGVWHLSQMTRGSRTAPK